MAGSDYEYCAFCGNKGIYDEDGTIGEYVVVIHHECWDTLRSAFPQIDVAIEEKAGTV